MADDIKAAPLGDGAPGSELEVTLTPAMVEAGRQALYEFGLDLAVTADSELLRNLFKRILTKMSEVRQDS